MSRSSPVHCSSATHSHPLNLLSLDQQSLEALVLRLGWPRFRGQQILRWLYRHRARDLEQLTDLSVAQRAQLIAIARIVRLQVYNSVTSTDGTRKLLACSDDGSKLESVLIPDERRLTLCISTQVGCTLDCQFCLTATMGLKRNLKAHEIVDQVLTAQDHLRPDQTLTNLVFMGMGEPLANFEAVAEAVARLTNSTWGVGIAARRITLSTAGLVPKLKDAAALGVNLAISLNATTDALRDWLMPSVNRVYPLTILMPACRALALPPRQRLTFEYVLLAGVNDSESDAKRLCKLLTGIRCKINLIPFNEFPGSVFHRPVDSAVAAFQSTVRRAGFDVFLRKSMGRDVLGACGQLGTIPTNKDIQALSPVGTRH